MDDVQILGARRSYDYQLDDIRLTWLSNRAVIQHIQQAFAFEVGTVAQPIDTFGQVQSTAPPGLVFHSGVAPFPEGSVTPVRFINIEPERIVIDVAGSSPVLASVLEMLMELVSGVRTSDDRPAIPEPRGARDYSEIRFRAPFLPSALLPRGVYDMIDSSLLGATTNHKLLVPVVELRLADRSSPYLGSGTPPYETMTIDLRAGTNPEEHVFYSGAPLDTDAHLDLLHRLESALLASHPRSIAERIE